MKKRLDTFLHDSGFFESRQSAKAAVMEGLVSVDGNRSVKPGTQVRGTEEIEIAPPARKFVSRGGLKLDHALEAFGVDPAGAVAVDIGASTGGFTDCLLKRGADKVYAVDVGKGQLDWSLRLDGRVVVLEGVNARSIEPDSFEVKPSLAVVDVSFISLEKVLGPLFTALSPDAMVVALVKPQFQAGRERVGRGGVVKDRAVHFDVLRSLVGWTGCNGMVVTAVERSPILGPKGNVEFFALIEREGEQVREMDIEKEVGVMPGAGAGENDDERGREDASR